MAWCESSRKGVIKEKSLTVRHGERTALIARNGAGKSTLLLLAAGSLKPDTGRLLRHRRVRTMLLTLAMGFDRKVSGRMNAILEVLFLGATLSEAQAAVPGIAELAEYLDAPLHPNSARLVRSPRPRQYPASGPFSS